MSVGSQTGGTAAAAAAALSADGERGREAVHGIGGGDRKPPLPPPLPMLCAKNAVGGGLLGDDGVDGPDVVGIYGVDRDRASAAAGAPVPPMPTLNETEEPASRRRHNRRRSAAAHTLAMIPAEFLPTVPSAIPDVACTLTAEPFPPPPPLPPMATEASGVTETPPPPFPPPPPMLCAAMAGEFSSIEATLPVSVMFDRSARVRRRPPSRPRMKPSAFAVAGLAAAPANALGEDAGGAAHAADRHSAVSMVRQLRW